MAITINGTTNTIAGLAVGGLNDGVVDADTIAANSRMVLEQFYSPCDGSTITTSQGGITLTDVTAAQDLTTTYADVTGSSISYTPPAGTTQVIYRFKYHWARDGDTSARASFRFYIDSDEVTNARWANGAGGGAGLQGHSIFEWGINIGGSAATATGRQASWSSAKTLKIQAREYTCLLYTSPSPRD